MKAYRLHGPAKKAEFIRISTMADKIEIWMCEELGKLGIDASEENARYILGIETAEELEEYMLELLDGTDRKTQKFVKELIVRWRPYNNSKINGHGQVYMKSNQDDSYVSGKDKKKSSTKHTERKPAPKNVLLNGHESNRGLMPGDDRPQEYIPVPDKQKHIQEKDVKKKQNKFVPLFSKEGQVKDAIQLSGRHTCECQAAKHKLISNCTKCGRVVCEQEGSGPCVFCGHLVCTPDEMEILSRGSKKSEKLRQHLLKDPPSELLSHTMFNGDRDYISSNNTKMKDGAVQAEKHKEKLLEYDKTSVRRTQVIDDESDYFTTDSKWLSKTDREALRKREDELRSQRHTSRKDRKVTLDFAGRRVIEEDNGANLKMYDVNDEVVQQVHYGARPKNSAGYTATNSDTYLVNPNIVQQAPQFVPQGPIPKKPSNNKTSTSSKTDVSRSLPRIQDRELQEMSDEGMCMSMHQPWASLLVCGIKIHEGRTWYTTHRGRLWIAATAKTPEPEEIADIEQTYRYLYKNPNLDFPSHYPTGCLLGCVDVTDCLPQDDYREKYPEGESGSPFVFICDSTQQLVVKFPIKGKHKLYKLDGHIHKAAKKGLR